MKRKSAILLCFVSLTFLLAACGATPLQSTTLPSLAPLPSAPATDEPAVDAVDLESVSANIWAEFSESFGYPGAETSWFKYTDSIIVEEMDGKYYAVVIVNTENLEAIDRIGNTVYGNYCIKDFDGIDIYATFVYDADLNSLFSRTD